MGVLNTWPQLSDSHDNQIRLDEAGIRLIAGAGLNVNLQTSQGGAVQANGAAIAAGASVLTAKVPITSAQIKTFDSTTQAVVELVPAPGPNKLINVLSVVIEYKFGTTPYTPPAGGQLTIFLGTFTNGNVIASTNQAGFIDSGSNQVFIQNGGAGGAVANAVDVVNQHVAVGNANSAAAATLGDGTLIITVQYTVEDLS